MMVPVHGIASLPDARLSPSQVSPQNDDIVIQACDIQRRLENIEVWKAPSKAPFAKSRCSEPLFSIHRSEIFEIRVGIHPKGAFSYCGEKIIPDICNLFDLLLRARRCSTSSLTYVDLSLDLCTTDVGGLAAVSSDNTIEIPCNIA